MDLILWRHAQAKEANGDDDMARALTPHGHEQARRVAKWLDARLPRRTRVLCSPALRAKQTARALGRRFELRDELAPGAAPGRLLDLVHWPDAKPTFLVVGHQPALGRTIAGLLGLRDGECAIKKGALWWLRRRTDRPGEPRISVVTLITPELL